MIVRRRWLVPHATMTSAHAVLCHFKIDSHTAGIGCGDANKYVPSGTHRLHLSEGISAFRHADTPILPAAQLPRH
jgi:hypothetical protein